MGMESIGILCERVRVEEKNILAVLQNEGCGLFPSRHWICPSPSAQILPPYQKHSCWQYPVLIDRCPERSAGSHAVSCLLPNRALMCSAQDWPRPGIVWLLPERSLMPDWRDPGRFSSAPRRQD